MKNVYNFCLSSGKAKILYSNHHVNPLKRYIEKSINIARR